jgi:hypothetical protein
MRRYFYTTSFLILSPIAFFLTFFLYLYVSFHADPNAKDSLFFRNVRTVAFAALPTVDSFFSGEATSDDARVEIVRQFLARYHSPLEPHAAFIVETAEKYNMDYRLIPAIAMQESNLCKKSRPEAYNCWGFGIYGDQYLHFDSYEQGIETVTKTLAEKYKDKHGLITAEEIMSMYTPNSNGSWANGVNYFMAEME